MTIRYVEIIISGALAFNFAASPLIADSTRTRIQVSLDNVQIAMNMYAEDHEGRLPTMWNDFSPYLEDDALREFASTIKLLTASGEEVHIGGRRILAISRTPSRDGTYAAIQEPTSVRAIVDITEQQLREVGLDPFGIEFRSSTPVPRNSQAPDDIRSRKGPSDELLTPPPPDGSAVAPRESSAPVSRAYIFIFAFMAILAASLVWRFRKRSRE